MPTTTQGDSGEVVGRIPAAAVCTRIEHAGKLVYEPGMSEEEHQARDFDASWSLSEQRALMDEMVEFGVKTREAADLHTAAMIEKARRCRVLVEGYDAERKRNGLT